MALDLSRLPVGEIRRRFLDEAGDVSPRVLGKLRRDRREGVRRIYLLLKKRYEREREERLRLDAMLHFERLLWASGVARIAGVDEAGMGPLAGPVVAAAVVFPQDVVIPGVDDSKRLDAARREELAVAIRERALHVATGRAEVEEIDALNIYHAGKLAMRRAVEALAEPPQHVLCDAREIPGLEIPQNRFDKGDHLNFSIAAASIIAKTSRDAFMEELDRRHPGYGLARHKGYSTPEHQAAIRRLGPSSVHRRSFPFIRELCGQFSDGFYGLRERLTGTTDRRELAALEDEVGAMREQLQPEEWRKLKLILHRRWSHS